MATIPPGAYAPEVLRTFGVPRAPIPDHAGARDACTRARAVARVLLLVAPISLPAALEAARAAWAGEYRPAQAAPKNPTGYSAAAAGVRRAARAQDPAGLLGGGRGRPARGDRRARGRARRVAPGVERVARDDRGGRGRGVGGRAAPARRPPPPRRRSRHALFFVPRRAGVRAAAVRRGRGAARPGGPRAGVGARGGRRPARAAAHGGLRGGGAAARRGRGGRGGRPGGPTARRRAACSRAARQPRSARRTTRRCTRRRTRRRARRGTRRRRWACGGTTCT